MHRREQIIEKVLAQFKAGFTIVAPGNVLRNAKYPLSASQVPSVNILQGPDAPLGEFGFTNVSFLDRQLVLFFDITAEGEDDLDAALNAIDREIHIALAADLTQGLPFVITSMPGNVGEPDTEVQGSVAVGTMRTEWAFQYRSSITDPGA